MRLRNKEKPVRKVYGGAFSYGITANAMNRETKEQQEIRASCLRVTNKGFGGQYLWVKKGMEKPAVLKLN